MYGPVFTSANRLKGYQSTHLQAVLLDQIKEKGPIAYKFLLAVFKAEEPNPFFIVSAEKSNALATLDVQDLLGDEEDDTPVVIPGETYFLCYFDQNGHYNLGSSSEWGDADIFEAKALALIEERLGERLQAI